MRSILGVLTWLALAAPGEATDSALVQDARLEVVLRVEPSPLAPSLKAELGDLPRSTGRLGVVFQIPAGFYLWALDPGPGPQPLTIDVEGPVRLDGPWFGPSPVGRWDRGFERELSRYEGEVRLEHAFGPTVTEGVHSLTIRVRGQICSDEQCIPQDLRQTVAFEVSPAAVFADPPRGVPLAMVQPRQPGEAEPGEAEPGEAEPRLDAANAREPSTHRDPAPPSGARMGGFDGRPEATALARAKSGGLLGFLGIAFTFGLLALATPCVFPAIPLTVSFFSNHQGSGRKAIKLAAVYAMTMVVSFTVVGVLVSVVFGVAQIQRFAAHPVFNLILALALVFFSLNLLGLFELRAPAFLVAAANALEVRFGRGRRPMAKPDSGEATLGTTDRGSYLAVAIAAITATTVFFTCTVAFVGLLLVEAARGDWFWPSVGMLAFSSAFALPFFLLALFPSLALKLRHRSGRWMMSIRVVLGFLELAASLKFFSNADLVWSLGLLSREAVLALWIALFLVCGLYLLGKVRLVEPSSDAAQPGADGPRGPILGALGSVAAFALCIYLGQGLFTGRPFGSWLDGWLPPLVLPSSHARTVSGLERQGATFAWMNDLVAAREQAARTGKPVFVNYTGYTCTNCRYMEGAVFPRPEVAALLEQMVLVELYTDGGTPQTDRNRDDQIERFRTLALPLYSIERGDGTIVAVFESSTNDPEEFRRFLAEGLAAAQVPALGLRARRLSDGASASEAFAGRWTLVNFWATYCPPCLVELREFLVRMGQALEAEGGRFLAVAIEEKDSVAEAHAFIRGLGLADERSLWMDDASLASALDARFRYRGTLPHTALVSPAGEVVFSHSGALSEDELLAVIRSKSEMLKGLPHPRGP